MAQCKTAVTPVHWQVTAVMHWAIEMVSWPLYKQILYFHILLLLCVSNVDLTLSLSCSEYWRTSWPRSYPVSMLMWKNTKWTCPCLPSTGSLPSLLTTFHLRHSCGSGTLSCLKAARSVWVLRPEYSRRTKGGHYQKLSAECLVMIG